MANVFKKIYKAASKAVSDVSKTVSKEVSNLGSSISKAGSQLDDFVNENIPGGWLGAAAITAGLYYGPEIFGGEALFDAAASGGGAGAGAGSGAGTAAGAGSGALGTGLTVGAAGEGLLAPTLPSLSAMGGASGLVTEAAGGGLLSALGVTPLGAVPMLGSAGSFINNPAVIGNPVIGYTPTPAFTLNDALNAAKLSQSLFNRPQIPQPQPQEQQQSLFGSTNYEDLLRLITAGKARTPNVAPIVSGGLLA